MRALLQSLRRIETIGLRPARSSIATKLTARARPQGFSPDQPTHHFKRGLLRDPARLARDDSGVSADAKLTQPPIEICPINELVLLGDSEGDRMVGAEGALEIRVLHRHGRSIREIALDTGASRNLRA
jgi:hypothetical protein